MNNTNFSTTKIDAKKKTKRTDGQFNYVMLIYVPNFNLEQAHVSSFYESAVDCESGDRTQ